MVNEDEYIIMVTKDFHFYLLPFFLFGPIFSITGGDYRFFINTGQKEFVGVGSMSKTGLCTEVELMSCNLRRGQIIWFIVLYIAYSVRSGN